MYFMYNVAALYECERQQISCVKVEIWLWKIIIIKGVFMSKKENHTICQRSIQLKLDFFLGHFFPCNDT